MPFTRRILKEYSKIRKGIYENVVDGYKFGEVVQ